MTRTVSLEQVRIPDPCPAAWEAMAGDDRTRFCGSCQKHVHDLSARTRAEGEALLAADYPHGLCVQFRVGSDGRVITRDPPFRRSWRRVWATASMAIAFVLTLVGCRRENNEFDTLRGSPLPITRTAGMVSPGEAVIMGDVSPATTAPATRPTTRPVINIRGKPVVPPTPHSKR